MYKGFAQPLKFFTLYFYYISVFQLTIENLASAGENFTQKLLFHSGMCPVTMFKLLAYPPEQGLCVFWIRKFADLPKQ